MKKRLSYLLVAIAILASFVPFAQPVYADTATLTVLAEGAETGGYYAAGTIAGMNVDDNATTFLRMGASGYTYHGYKFDEFTTVVNSITSVTFYFKITVPSSNDFMRAYVRIGGNDYMIDPLVSNVGWSLHSRTWATNPATGVAWTVSDLSGANRAQFGLQSAIYTSNNDWTYAYVVVDYIPLTVPTVTATAPTTYDDESATLIGNITATGGATPDNYGFVWGTIDQGDPGNFAPADGIGGWTKGWAVGVGSYPVAQYTHVTGNTLVKNTTYFIRFAAHNSVGWEYSSVVSFKTIGDPTIATVAASLVGKTTATLQAQVTSDGKVGGGEDCTVTFIYKIGNFADYAAILAAGGTEVAATGNPFNAGEYPSLAIGSLTANSLYSFAVKIINSTTTTAYGSRLYFTTTLGIDPPTNLLAIPSSITASISWIKGSGAPLTLVKYRIGSYPAVTTDGLTAHLGSGTSAQVIGLTAGTTYYVSAWGIDAGVYSVTPTTSNVLFTTIVPGAAAAGTLPTPPAYTPWNQTPDATKASTWPVAGQIMSNIATEYGTPINWLWYLVWIIFSAMTGVVLYNKAGFNLPMSAGASGIILAGGAIAFGLVMLYIFAAFAIIYAGFSMFGERRQKWQII